MARKKVDEVEGVDLGYLTDMKFEPKAIKCITTNKLYENVKSACADNGLSWYRMWRHLNGEVSSLKGLKFEYSDEVI